MSGEGRSGAVYDPGRLLVSIHVPKTAGTSFRAVLERWFGPRLFLQYPGWPRFDRPDVGGDACLHGHFNVEAGHGWRHAAPDAAQFITVLRDPFDRLVSLYRHRLRHEAAPDGALASFDAFLELHLSRRPAPGLPRYAVEFPPPVAPDRPHDWLDGRFLIVGVTDAMEETVERLAAVLGKPRVDIPRDNAAPDGAADFAAWRPLHERAFAAEHELYHRARDLLRRAEV